MAGCFYTSYNQGYVWYRPPLISDPWLDAIEAGTQSNPLLMPDAPPVPPSPPPVSSWRRAGAAARSA